MLFVSRRIVALLTGAGLLVAIATQTEAQADSLTTPTVPADRPPNVIIYLIDTLRADHLGCYGYSKPTSPNIDRFAAEATLYTDAFAQSSWTRPAVASVFTGLYPRSHGVNQRQDALPESLSTKGLPALLQQAGYRTAAFVTNGNVGARFGFRAGFDTWVYLGEQVKTKAIHQYSDRVNEKVFAWLEQQLEDQPFFLYVHTTDPHGPYTPPSRYREQFAGSVQSDWIGSKEHVKRVARRRFPFLSRSRIELSALYDAEIAFNDAQFGMLLDKLKALGLYDSSLIVLLSDHGEEFYEHGGWQHGQTLFAEQLNIPLIIKFPHGTNQRHRVGAVARQIDILPTILGVLGREIPSDLQGRSLLSAATSETDTSDQIRSFAYVKLDGREAESMIVDGYKLIHHLAANRPRRRFELYRWGNDKGDRYNLSDSEPLVLARLKAELQEARQQQTVLAEPEQAVLDAVTEERLRALGYLP